MTPLIGSKPRAIILIAVVSFASPSEAETLGEAIAIAYRTNPTLQSQRSQLRALDQAYASTITQLGPTVQIQITSSYQRDHLGKSTRDAQRITTKQLPDYFEQNIAQGDIVVTQPLYTGGRVSAEIDSAAAKIRAGREGLKASEGRILLAVIQAYVDVRRDLQALEVRRLNLDAIRNQLTETTARWKAGEVTQTDVAQAEAQLASEQALLAQARGQLMVDRAAYFEVVGQNPGDLAPEPDLEALPESVDEAFEIAEQHNPDLKQAYFLEAESRSRLAATKSAYRETLSLSAQYGYSGSAVPFYAEDLQRTAVGQITFSRPLYSGGLQRARVGQSVELNNSDRFNIEVVRRGVIQNVANFWSQIIASQEAINSHKVQIRAAEIALKGMRIEYKTGERSTLDVLIAEGSLRDAELKIINARHDLYIAKANILRQTGRLEVGILSPKQDIYQPAEHFQEVLAEVPTLAKIVRKVDGLGKRSARVGRPSPSIRSAYREQLPQVDSLTQLPERIPASPVKDHR